MKTLPLICALFSTLLQLSFAGGTTSTVRLEKISSIKVEENRITIVGSGMLQKRVMTDAKHGDSTCFGQPTQMLHAKVTDCIFEIVPYHIREDLSGVPGPSPRNMTEEMKAQSLKWWQGTLAEAKKIKGGDAVTIGYQREKMTLTSVFVTHIVGSGSVRLVPKKK